MHAASTVKNKASSLPEKSFEAFWQTFEDHYAFFALRKIDWHADYQQYRQMVNAATSDDSLFTLFTKMVIPFADDHISINIPKGESFELEKPSAFLKEFPGERGERSFWKMVDSTLVRNAFSPVQAAGPVSDGEHLFYYSASNDWGYIRITRCFVTEQSEGHPKKDAEKAGKLFDEVLEQLKDKKGMIIDLRLNGGGNDAFSYALAGRFTTTKTLGHSRQTRTGGYEDFGPREQWWVVPLGNSRFTGPLIVLTNDQTSSGAEVITLALKALPQTKTIGENTTGIFSDMYFFKLPNKWEISLSNQRYFSNSNICYEGAGIPPDIRVSNTKNDLVIMTDPVLRVALATLEKTVQVH
ncbi:MAG: S41 family peptidase [Chitinophagaceae bacterium]